MIQVFRVAKLSAAVGPVSMCGDLGRCLYPAVIQFRGSRIAGSPGCRGGIRRAPGTGAALLGIFPVTLGQARTDGGHTLFVGDSEPLSTFEGPDRH